MQDVQLVWFKRDLRISDHQPLYEASQRGPILPLYVIEPEVIYAPDYDRRHWDFMRACLLELRENLTRLGAPLVVRQGNMLDVLRQLYDTCSFRAMWAHEETGNAITYARDLAVIRWAKQNNIPFHEIPNNGVIRKLKNRDERIKRWHQRMSTPLTPTPAQLEAAAGVQPGTIPTSEALNLHDEGIVSVQPAGEQAARAYLHSFLYERGHSYHREMSSPVTAENSCSRMSVYLAYGVLSIKQIITALRKRRAEIRAMPPDECKQLPGSWKKALSAFESRLHWHDHFIQRLEDEPPMEYTSLVPQYDGLRDDPDSDEQAAQRWNAFMNGCTGYPMVDASIRSLKARGWINFRMRAMLVSFASYDLWLPWQQTSTFTARLFTDYEPGIHYSQSQMQSGTTGINTLRIYNPIKQGYDHDAHGQFIRQWIPELQHVPVEHIHEPWTMPPMTELEARCKIGVDYPAPIVDHTQAVRVARQKIGEIRKLPEVKEAARHVFKRHGSRKRRH